MKPVAKYKYGCLLVCCYSHYINFRWAHGDSVYLTALRLDARGVKVFTSNKLYQQVAIQPTRLMAISGPDKYSSRQELIFTHTTTTTCQPWLPTPSLEAWHQMVMVKTHLNTLTAVAMVIGGYFCPWPLSWHKLSKLGRQRSHSQLVKYQHLLSGAKLLWHVGFSPHNAHRTNLSSPLIGKSSP